MAGEETSSPTLVAQFPVLRTRRATRARRTTGAPALRLGRERRLDRTQLEQQRPLPHALRAERLAPYSRAPLSSRERTETVRCPEPLERTDPWQQAPVTVLTPRRPILTFSLAFGLGFSLLLVLAALLLLLT